jgi:hypothetical protein
MIYNNLQDIDIVLRKWRRLVRLKIIDMGYKMMSPSLIYRCRSHMVDKENRCIPHYMYNWMKKLNHLVNWILVHMEYKMMDLLTICMFQLHTVYMTEHHLHLTNHCYIHSLISIWHWRSHLWLRPLDIECMIENQQYLCKNQQYIHCMLMNHNLGHTILSVQWMINHKEFSIVS